MIFFNPYWGFTRTKMQNCSQQGPSLILSSFNAAWVFRARILEFRALESSVLELPGGGF